MTLLAVEILEKGASSCSKIKVRPSATIKAKRFSRGLKRSMWLVSATRDTVKRGEVKRGEVSLGGLALISRDTAKVNGPRYPRTRKILPNASNGC